MSIQTSHVSTAQDLPWQPLTTLGSSGALNSRWAGRDMFQRSASKTARVLILGSESEVTLTFLFRLIVLFVFTVRIIMFK